MRGARRIYAPLLPPRSATGSASRLIAALLVGVCAYRRIPDGREFIPSLDEGDIVDRGVRIPGTSLTQSLEMEAMLEKRCSRFPEVKEVFARTGTAEVATDPMPPSTADNSSC